MAARTPSQLHELFEDYFNAQDVEALLSLYEPTATLVPSPGSPVNGHAAIREAIQGFLSRGGQMKIAIKEVFQAGDIALLLSRWTINRTDPVDTSIERTGQTSDVARRQSDGTWLLVIDNPYGGEAAQQG
jgi:uncharacterized protein (TIGR02246 family)